jgi:hypothetical protein
MIHQGVAFVRSTRLGYMQGSCLESAQEGLETRVIFAFGRLAHA